MALKRKGKISNYDPQLTASNTYSDASGAQKNVEVGKKFLPIQTATAAWTTDATTALQVEKGVSLAIYNKGATLYSLTCGATSSVTAGAVGAVDGSGNVSIPCKTNDWTYIAVGEENWIKTEHANLVVFTIKDDTILK